MSFTAHTAEFCKTPDILKILHTSTLPDRTKIPVVIRERYLLEIVWNITSRIIERKIIHSYCLTTHLLSFLSWLTDHYDGERERSKISPQSVWRSPGHHVNMTTPSSYHSLPPTWHHHQTCLTLWVRQKLFTQRGGQIMPCTSLWSHSTFILSLIDWESKPGVISTALFVGQLRDDCLQV